MVAELGPAQPQLVLTLAREAIIFLGNFGQCLRKGDVIGEAKLLIKMNNIYLFAKRYIFDLHASKYINFNSTYQPKPFQKIMSEIDFVLSNFQCQTVQTLV